MSLFHTGNRSHAPAIPALSRKHFNAQSLFMIACCAAMIAGTGLLITSAPSGLTWTETLLLAAPMLGCLAMHAVMHRFMGTSCHATNKTGADQ
ncbi:hypothetical protein [Roseibium sediminicola]|uniref:DUF2933 domain-containing protein n=1 Tax=Roseibium sediminicola TaxID=2933272 RepID=A0ABT0H1Z7_9HYPH|nr:hypothetical protein [Roseibium sp. CAU 1639]MCK7615696.1 hypothetical protein [Roseibium sp. CAU 1639]